MLIHHKSYAEMDLVDLLSFHDQSQNTWTEAHDASGHLGVTLLDRMAIQDGGEPESLANSLAQTCYQFRGYAKRIFSARERRELAHDVFTGACSMRPLGTQVHDQAIADLAEKTYALTLPRG